MVQLELKVKLCSSFFFVLFLFFFCICIQPHWLQLTKTFLPHTVVRSTDDPTFLSSYHFSREHYITTFSVLMLDWCFWNVLNLACCFMTWLCSKPLHNFLPDWSAVFLDVVCSLIFPKKPSQTAVFIRTATVCIWFYLVVSERRGLNTNVSKTLKTQCHFYSRLCLVPSHNIPKQKYTNSPHLSHLIVQ